jgi:DNA-binding IclR family transcriptional regulator
MTDTRSSLRYSGTVPDTSTGPADTGPRNHRTIDRVTQILEEVVYRPGITFAELARALDAPKSSVYGFIQGLLAKGWLHEDDRRFYLGPAVYGLTLASGHIRAGTVTQEDLDALHRATGQTVFLGVEAGDHLIYIGESGTDALTGFAARSNIRRELISTAGGKALLAEKPAAERDAYLRRQQAKDPDLVEAFLAQISDITNTGVARNHRHHGAQLALAAAVHDRAGKAIATAIILGPTTTMAPREASLRRTLLKHVATWQQHAVSPREAI